MTIEFEKFQSDKILPGKVLEFVLKSSSHGMASPEFAAAVKKGDPRNIVDGIDSIIMNAETRFGIALSEADKFRIQMAAQDEIVRQVLNKVEKDSDTAEKLTGLQKFSEHISRTNRMLSHAFEVLVKEQVYG